MDVEGCVWSAFGMMSRLGRVRQQILFRRHGDRLKATVSNRRAALSPAFHRLDFAPPSPNDQHDDDRCQYGATDHTLNQ